MREMPSGLALGGILGLIGIGRILLWQLMYNHGWHMGDFTIAGIHFNRMSLGYDYGVYVNRIALTMKSAQGDAAPSGMRFR